jgi:predicted nucleic acid-binding protein
VNYWDTSCLLKLYLYESDSDRYTAILRRQTPPVTTSVLGETEFAFAVARREADGSIAAGAAGELVQLFLRHCGEGHIHLVGLTPGIRELATSLARRFHLEENPSLPLRTVDGLHLATAMANRSRSFITADQRLAAAARLCGMTVP